MPDTADLPSSSVHFTYKPEPDRTTLCQGDVLCITPELKAVLSEIHPYFINEQYKYFIVLTQSCDLVRRGSSPCNSQYITLAAVRSFDDFFEKEMQAKHYAVKVADFLLMEDRNKARATQLIERLYNNTEQDYFFLYKENLLDFPKSMVAYLKVSFALRADEHYDQCLQAKKFELADEFKAKLGWLVGNIYSRVGTTDWDSIIDSSQKQSMIDGDISSRCIICPKKKYDKLKKEIKNNTIINATDARTFLESLEIKSNYDRAISIVSEILDKRQNKLPESEKRIIMDQIKSNSSFKQLFPSDS